MEHTNEFLRGMFAAYMGCEVQYVDTDNRKIVAKLTGVSVNDGLETTYKRKRKSIAGGYVSGDYLSFKPNDNHNTDALHCKPILISLSEITDEDAVEVAKICEHSHTIEAGKRIVSDIMYYSPINHLHIIDYLRSPYRPGGTPKPVYDLGYMHIPSLIAADLAISSKQI